MSEEFDKCLACGEDCIEGLSHCGDSECIGLIEIWRAEGSWNEESEEAA